MRNRFVTFLGVRVTQDTHTAFVKKARSVKGADRSEVLRELIQAFIEDRITITPAIKEIIK